MPKVSLIENGPIRVSGFSKIVRMIDGGEVEVAAEAALCRCGHSKNKPFCDGSHVAAGFKSEKEAGRLPDKLDVYEGDEVVIHDNRGQCAHAAYCTKNLPKVFKYGEEPWIDAEGASAEEVMKLVSQCPSGALSAKLRDKEFPESNSEQTVAFVPNGPYVFGGGCELDGIDTPEGGVASKKTLCRCGKSLNKPYCNGAHHNVKFDEDVRKKI